MSKYFGWIQGKAYDFSFKPLGDDLFTCVYLGEHLICQVSKNDRKGWAVIVQGELSCGWDNPVVPRLVEGFKSRWSAIEYALQVHHLTAPTYNR